LAIFEIYYQHNLFLGIFQLKFCLKTVEICLLLYVSSVLQYSILAIILFKYQVPERQRWSGEGGRLKLPGWYEHPILPPTFRAYGYRTSAVYQLCYSKRSSCVSVTAEA